MTSRERLLRVLRGRMPDRVPISTYELVGYDTDNFCNQEPSYQRMMDDIRTRTDCVCMWNVRACPSFFGSAAVPDVRTDVREVPGGREERRTLVIGHRTLTNTHRWTDGIHTVWNTEHWCKDMGDVDAIMSLPYEPLTYDAGDYTRIEAEMGERGIIMSSLSDPAYLALLLMAFGDATVWALTEPEHFAGVVERIHRRVMDNLERELAAKTVDLYRICGPEYMTPPYLPRAHFERFMVPYVRDMVDLIHQKGGMVRLHCHGRIGTLLDLFEQLGVEATDPCEGPPDGDVTLAEVKRRIGGHVTLFGNLQLKLLECGTPQQVREEVLRAMDAAKPGGRFVIMPTAAPINVPLSQQTEENYRVFIDTALEAGAY